MKQILTEWYEILKLLDQIFESIVRDNSEERASNVLVETRNELLVESRDEIFEVLFV